MGTLACVQSKLRVLPEVGRRTPLAPIDFRILRVVVVRLKVRLHGLLLLTGELVGHLCALKVSPLRGRGVSSTGTRGVPLRQLTQAKKFLSTSESTTVLRRCRSPCSGTWGSLSSGPTSMYAIPSPRRGSALAMFERQQNNTANTFPRSGTIPQRVRLNHAVRGCPGLLIPGVGPTAAFLSRVTPNPLP